MELNDVSHGNTICPADGSPTGRVDGAATRRMLLKRRRPMALLPFRRPLKCTVVELGAWDRQTDRQVIWHDASRSQWQEYALEIGEILHIFPLAPKVWETGDPKRLTRVRGQVYIYLRTKFGCDRSIVE